MGLRERRKRLTTGHRSVVALIAADRGGSHRRSSFWLCELGAADLLAQPPLQFEAFGPSNRAWLYCLSRGRHGHAKICRALAVIGINPLGGSVLCRSGRERFYEFERANLGALRAWLCQSATVHAAAGLDGDHRSGPLGPPNRATP
jgi:hypothetical protein